MPHISEGTADVISATLLILQGSGGERHYHQKRFEELDQHELPDTWAPMIAPDEK